MTIFSSNKSLQEVSTFIPTGWMEAGQFEMLTRDILLFEPNRREVLHARRLSRYNGSYVLKLPYMQGMPLREYLHKINTAAEALELLRLLWQALSHYPPIDHYHIDMIYVLNPQKIMLLPAALVNLSAQFFPDAYARELYRPFHYARATQENQKLFFMAVIAYRLFAGWYPFEPEQTDEELQEQIAGGLFVPLRKEPVDAKPLLVHLIDESLKACSNQHQWALVLAMDNEDLLYQQNIIATAEQLAASSLLGRQLKRRLHLILWLKKYLVTSLTGLMITIFLLMVMPFFNDYHELSQGTSSTDEEIIRAYYAVLNNYDIWQFSAVSDSKASQKDEKGIKMVHNVIKRHPYESASYRIIINPAQYREEGSGVLENGQYIFGVSDLHIEKIDENHYKVYYTKWYPSLWVSERNQQHYYKGAFTLKNIDDLTIGSRGKNHRRVIVSIRRRSQPNGFQGVE